MERIRKLQGPPPPASASLGKLQHEVAAEQDGIVTTIDCYAIARIARLAGAPNDKGAGIDLLKKVGDRVERGEPLYRIHAGLPIDFKFAVERAQQDSAFTLNAIQQSSRPSVAAV
jgi:thymidine phosphorylase